MNDNEFDSDNAKKISLSDESLLDTDDSKTVLQPINDNSQLKPLGDITIELEDIVPSKYSKVILCV